MAKLFQHIMVPVDFTEKNTSALRVALDVAIHSQAQLTLLHVIERIEQESDDEIRDFYATLEIRARQSMEQLANKFADRGWPIQQEVIYGRRGLEIIEYQIQRGIDLVVLSSHKVPLDQPQGSLGTLSHQISILCQCPVLLVK